MCHLKASLSKSEIFFKDPKRFAVFEGFALYNSQNPDLYLYLCFLMDQLLICLVTLSFWWLPRNITDVMVEPLPASYVQIIYAKRTYYKMPANLVGKILRICFHVGSNYAFISAYASEL